MKDQLNNMLNTLQEYKRDRTDLMQTYVEERLNKSFERYSHEIQQSILVLTRKHEKSILKRLEKINVKHCN